MSGRGRGGRGGRGGISKSFNREQLNSMGLAGNEVLPGPVTQPPPLYPLLEHKPVPLTMPYDKSKQPEQEIDKLVAQLPSVKEKYDWSLFPSELRPKVLAHRTAKAKAGKSVDVQQRLNQLEKIEETNVAKVVKEEDEEAQEEEDVLEEEQDEEMDDGTDYANNYFDNGEGYEDEDDNLDDGPIY